MYTERVIEHFRKPHNMGRMEDYSAIGKVGNIVCGDVMWLYIKVEEDDQGRHIIRDISWETFGCTAAIATSSMVSDLAKGKSIEEAISITNRQVADQLGGLPPVKMHCSALAAEALNEAIYNYMTEKGMEIPDVLQKRHQRVQKDIEALEKRYQAFMDRETAKSASSEEH